MSECEVVDDVDLLVLVPQFWVCNPALMFLMSSSLVTTCAFLALLWRLPLFVCVSVIVQGSATIHGAVSYATLRPSVVAFLLSFLNGGFLSK